MQVYSAKANRWPQSFGYHWRFAHNSILVALSDAVAVGIAILSVGAFGQHPTIHTLLWSIPLAWWCGAGVLGLIPGWGLGFVEELRRTVILGTLAIIIVVIIQFAQNGAADFPRLTATMLIGIALVLAMRAGVKRILINWGIWGAVAVVYGGNPGGAQLIRTLTQEPELGYQVVGAFNDRADPDTCIAGVPVLGETDMAAPEASVAIWALAGNTEHRMLDLLHGPLSCYRRVLIVPALFDVPSLQARPRDLRGMVGLEVPVSLNGPFAQWIKRAADVMLIVFSAIIWVPLCIVIALCVWVQDGHSPFFIQDRVGCHGSTFRAYKFRTMMVNAEDVLQQRLAEDPALRREWEKSYKLKNDPRVTPLGAFLRRTSLDELPQVINILRGEMSLVGPRAITRYHYDELSEQVQTLRAKVRPGLTGLWQVSGRVAIGTDGMERLDAYYVRNRSIWLDMAILIRTVRAVINGTGAY